MEKINVIEDVKGEEDFNINLDNDPEINIDSLVSWIEKIKSLGATHIEIYSDVYDGSLDDLSFSPRKVRLETDDEFNVRESKDALDNMVQKERQKVADIREFARLKNKLKL